MSESSVVQLAMGDQNHFMPPVQHKTYFVWNFAVKHNYGRLTARDRASAVFRSHLMHDGSDFCFIFFLKDKTNCGRLYEMGNGAIYI
jgi:hypothetical protein